MKCLQLVIITIHLTSIFSKKKHRDMSSESVENILYYQDCNHKQKPDIMPLARAAPPRTQECKMCCTMCCGDQCVDSHQVELGRQAGQAGTSPIEPVMPIQPEGMTPRERRKKLKVPLPIRPPLPGRRSLDSLGFTRENIKSLISQDEDIRKILKDLVRVTMQKVDLMKMINNTPNAAPARMERQMEDNDSENDL